MLQIEQGWYGLSLFEERPPAMRGLKRPLEQKLLRRAALGYLGVDRIAYPLEQLRHGVENSGFDLG